MTLPSLIRLAALSSILAGAMRTVASFIPYTSDSVPLELLYLVIDISLLFAMIGIYAREHAQTGITGFSGFVLAVAGAASIVGPDGTLGGIDLYSVGAL